MRELSKTEKRLNDCAVDLEENILNRIAEATRRSNQHFWTDLATGEPLTNRNKGEMYMLMVSELAEGFEALRKSQTEVQMDKHLPQYPAEVVELADLYIRLMDYVGEYYPETFGPAVAAKRAYNKTRKDHTRDARMAPGGKAF